MRQQDWCVTVTNTTAFHQSCVICTGFEFLNAKSSVWPFKCSTAATRQHLNICRDNYSEPSITNRDDDCGQRRLRDSYAELDLEQPAIVPSELPLLAYGTVYQPTLSLHSRWQLSRNGFVQTVTPLTTTDVVTCLSSHLGLRQAKYCRTCLLTYLRVEQ